jgi:hypothetical protein
VEQCDAYDAAKVVFRRTFFGMTGSVGFALRAAVT